MGADQRIRVGVIGLGLIAQSVHLPSLSFLRDRFVVARVCDVSRQLATAIADQLPGQVRVSADWREVCADESVDAVLVLTPGGHAEISLAALRAGQHVLSEKPLCLSQAEARELDQAARRAGRVLQVGYMKMYDPAVAEARAARASLGAERVVRVTVLHPSDECQYEHVRLLRFADADPALIAAAERYAANGLARALGDAPAGLAGLYTDVLLGSVVHELSVLRALGFRLPAAFDYADARTAAGPLSPDEPAAEPPCLLAVADLGGGTQLQLAWNWVPDYPEYTEEVTIFGAAGRLHLLMPGPYLPAHRAALRVETADGEIRRAATYRAGYRTGFVAELAAFADSIGSGAPARADAAGAGEDTRCLQALLTAVATRSGAVLGGEAAAPAAAAPAAATLAATS